MPNPSAVTVMRSPSSFSRLPGGLVVLGFKIWLRLWCGLEVRLAHRAPLHLRQVRAERPPTRMAVDASNARAKDSREVLARQQLECFIEDTVEGATRRHFGDVASLWALALTGAGLNRAGLGRRGRHSKKPRSLPRPPKPSDHRECVKCARISIPEAWPR